MMLAIVTVSIFSAADKLLVEQSECPTIVRQHAPLHEGAPDGFEGGGPPW